MDSSPEINVRRAELERQAPLFPLGLRRQVNWSGRDVMLLCGTLGVRFDAWQRALSATSAADGYFAQMIGLEAVEREMDRLESEGRAEIEATGRRLLPRRSPGYGDLPLSMSREIIAALDATKLIGVSVTDTELLVPSKSVTAICEIE